MRLLHNSGYLFNEEETALIKRHHEIIGIDNQEKRMDSPDFVLTMGGVDVFCWWINGAQTNQSCFVKSKDIAPRWVTRVVQSFEYKKKSADENK